MKLLALISNVFLTISIYSQNELILQKINSEKVEIVINQEDEMNIDKGSSNEIQKKLKEIE